MMWLEEKSTILGPTLFFAPILTMNTASGTTVNFRGNYGLNKTFLNVIEMRRLEISVTP